MSQNEWFSFWFTFTAFVARFNTGSTGKTYVHFYLSGRYSSQLYRWVCDAIEQVQKKVKNKGFGNTISLLSVEIGSRLIEVMVDFWASEAHVFKFRIIEASQHISMPKFYV